ncbi:MAG: ROK family transcriptional regulator [Micromonosporaceae bacterium]|nr:ROK family transcriptional regulator [Micromonosporaceae bacterium]
MANRFAVLRHIITEGQVTRPEITAATGLSLATVATLVSELLELGMLAEVGQQESAGGRPRTVLAVRPRRGVLVGVDVTETYVHVELFDLNLGVLARAHRVLAPSQSRVEQVLEHVVSAVEEGIARCEVERDTVLGVGVSVPGQVDREGGVTVYAANWDWADVPMRDLISQRIRLPVYLDNPAKASTVAELWFGASRGYDDVAVLTLATGVGAGLAVGGSLYRGADNGAGEWGHTTLVLDGRPCRCGSRGCVETYVGAPGILQHIRELAPDSGLLQGSHANGNGTPAKRTPGNGTPAKSTGDQTATVAALAEALAAQDPRAGEVAAVTARHLGVAIANLVNLVNPQLVVLSGWVANRLGRYLLDEVCAVVAREALPGPHAATRIALCPIENPVTLGAATFALEGFLGNVRDWG